MTSWPSCLPRAKVMREAYSDDFQRELEELRAALHELGEPDE
jgi:hypothetical protein